MQKISKKIIGLIAITLILLVSLAYVLKNDKGIVDSVSHKKTEVYAWYPDYDEENALKSLQTSPVSQVSPFLYMIDTSGKLTVDETETKDQMLKTAKERNIAVLPSIVNDFDGERVHKLFINKDEWNDLSTQLISLAQENGYKGYDLDLEELLAKDRNSYTAFAKYLSARLHKEGLLLSITVHAQTGDPDPRDAEVAQDLRGLSKSADEIRVMAYDFHHSESEPGPVTPLDDLAKVLNETKRLVPMDKAVISLPTYGYDWNSKLGSDLQYADAIALIKKEDIAYHLDEKQQALTGTYVSTDGKHTIWFENARTLKAKVDMVKTAGFYKISLWRLGGEDPATWNLF